MTKQFAMCANLRYGAPMGRASYGIAENCEPHSIRLFVVRLDTGGYDDGAAYWGGSQTLYCATDNDGYCRFIRANSRAHAALLLDIEPKQLRMPLTRIAWGRYSAIKGFFGSATPGYEISDFGQIIGHVNDWAELCTFAQEKYK